MNAQQHADHLELSIEDCRLSVVDRRWPVLTRQSSICTCLSAAMLIAMMAGTARANAELGRVTLIAGAPRMVGESIRPLQAIFSGRMLETGEDDAAGLLIQDVVFHIGPNSRVTVLDEPGLKRIILERGFVVFYTEPETRTEVIVETPFGRLTSAPEFSDTVGSGWYSVRHDPERINVSPAVSTFAAMEGPAEKGAAVVLGTAPEVGPYELLPGQRWRIVQGEIPGAPEAGDERAAAEALGEMLYREAAEAIHAQSVDLAPLTTVDLGGVFEVPPGDLLEFEGQFIIDGSDANQDRLPKDELPPEPIEPVVVEPQLAFATPTVIAAGTPGLAIAQFVGYEGDPAAADWNRFLTAANGNPAFQPAYLTDFANAGFSYMQFTGADAQLADNDGEMFLATEQNGSSGWAIFTPLLAVGDAGFDPRSTLVGVVTEGFRAVATGNHLAGGGTIGGDGVDPGSAFAVVSNDSIQLNPNQPAGHPMLDRAADTTGLTVGGQAVSDQIAALGAGRDPQQLDQRAPQLVFISDGNADALGNQFNFDGDAINPTTLNLPGDRQVQLDNSGSAGLATPLSADNRNTVGIQFAGRGQTIAVIHHTGLANAAAGSEPTSDHFEIVRGARYSMVQWREDGRVTGADGQVLDMEDLNSNPELRNELFAFISQEVNNLVPAESHTVAGPAVSEPGAGVLRSLRPALGRLVRLRDTTSRREVIMRGIHKPVATRSLRLRTLRPATGRLIRDRAQSAGHRHIGRVSPRRSR